MVSKASDFGNFNVEQRIEWGAVIKNDIAEFGD